MDAENTHQVFDWLWSSGQLSEADIAALPALGVEAVINLALPTSTNALHGEAELVTGRGIAYLQIPVLFDKPQLRQLQQFFSALQMFEGRKVWVHCAKNMRVSAFIYLYRRLRLHESDADARYPMREVWHPDATWQAFIDAALASPAAGEAHSGIAAITGRDSALDGSARAPGP
jgi:protein tyrosine phosphatase (PTP) superfamily phosphohydrolase (DUF442 family)